MTVAQGKLGQYVITWGRVLESEFKRVLGTAQSAVGLLARSTIAPEPPAYGIVFRSLEFSADAVCTPEDLDAVRRAAERRAEAADAGLERAEVFSASLDAVAETVEAASAISARFDASLATAGRALDPSHIDATALCELLKRLITETDRANSANRGLMAELDSVRQQLGTLQAEIECARHDACSDGLTAIPNRRYFDRSLEGMISHAVSAGTPMAMLLLDLDDFHGFNAQFGHPAGDAVLRRVAGILAGLVRPGDLIARFGGEEFVAVLRDADESGAESFTARFRQALSRLPPAAPGAYAVTASYGIAALAPGDTPATLIERADRSLYAAKQSGRDHLVTAQSLATPSIPDTPLADESQSLLDLLADI